MDFVNDYTPEPVTPRRKNKWVPIVAELAEHPKQWARLHDYGSNIKAGEQFARQIVLRRIAAFAGHEWEAHVATDGWLMVRCLGPADGDPPPVNPRMRKSATPQPAEPAAAVAETPEPSPQVEPLISDEPASPAISLPSFSDDDDDFGFDFDAAVSGTVH